MQTKVSVSRIPPNGNGTRVVLEEHLPDSRQLDIWFKGLAKTCGLHVDAFCSLFFDWRQDSQPLDWQLGCEKIVLSDDHVLGCCFPYKAPGSIEIYIHNCIRCAGRIGVDPLDFIKKVCIHELAHLAMNKGLMNVRGEVYQWVSSLDNNRELVEHLAQMATFAFLLTSNQEKILTAMDKLSVRQASCYRTWEIWRDLQWYSEQKMAPFSCNYWG